MKLAPRDGRDLGRVALGEYPDGLLPSTALQLAVLSHPVQLLSMRHEWNALLRSSAADSVFLTWEWITTWFDVYGDGSQLHVMTARTADGSLVGLAPLKRTRQRFLGVPVGDVVEFIGQGGDVTPERLDFIARPGWEACVTNAFCDRLLADGSIGGLDLQPLNGGSPTSEHLTEALRSRAHGLVRCVEHSHTPTLPLPDSTIAFLASQSANYRKKVRECENRCERDLAARMRVTATPAELERDMAALVLLHRKRWKRRSRSFRSRQYLTFHQRIAALMLEQEWLRLFSFEAGDTRLASLYCFFYGGRYYFYQSGRDPRFARQRVGFVLMHRAILHAIGEGARVFDFLRGREDYKYQWAVSEATNLRFSYVGNLSDRFALSLRGVGFGLARSVPARRAVDGDRESRP